MNNHDFVTLTTFSNQYLLASPALFGALWRPLRLIHCSMQGLGIVWGIDFVIVVGIGLGEAAYS